VLIEVNECAAVLGLSNRMTLDSLRLNFVSSIEKSPQSKV
jgi:hypothetical protein